MDDANQTACALPVPQRADGAATAALPDAAAGLGKEAPAASAHALDLSSDEDLGIGIMNLISIEEHLFFTASKTGKNIYLEQLLEIREMRKTLLQQIVLSFEGEVWCISKHLLAASMRLMEVGTKELKVHGVASAQPYFEKSYRLFRMFWTVVLAQPPATQDAAADAAPPRKKEVVLYYEPGCRHCAALESFLERNHLYGMFRITKKDVSSDPANRAELEAVHRDCLQDGSERRVPVVTQDGQCAMGEAATIRLFKSLMWDQVKDWKQAVGTLLDQGKVPTQVKSHLAGYNDAVDAALDCCRE